MSEHTSIVELQKLECKSGHHYLLNHINWQVNAGEHWAVYGMNGCGKTTLLKILTGEMDYDDGEVFVNPNKRLGLISQIPHYPEHYTVSDVLQEAFIIALGKRDNSTYPRWEEHKNIGRGLNRTAALSPATSRQHCKQK